jgi:hypothetical protein
MTVLQNTVGSEAAVGGEATHGRCRFGILLGCSSAAIDLVAAVNIAAAALITVCIALFALMIIDTRARRVRMQAL